MKMRVAIKFCGGCDPTFDRVELANRVKDVADTHITWVDMDQDSKDAILVICGCPKACPVDDLQDTAIPLVVIEQEFNPYTVVDRILRRGKANEN